MATDTYLKENNDSIGLAALMEQPELTQPANKFKNNKNNSKVQAPWHDRATVEPSQDSPEGAETQVPAHFLDMDGFTIGA